MNPISSHFHTIQMPMVPKEEEASSSNASFAEEQDSSSATHTPEASSFNEPTVESSFQPTVLFDQLKTQYPDVNLLMQIVKKKPRFFEETKVADIIHLLFAKSEKNPRFFYAGNFGCFLDLLKEIKIDITFHKQPLFNAALEYLFARNVAAERMLELIAPFTDFFIDSNVTTLKGASAYFNLNNQNARLCLRNISLDSHPKMMNIGITLTVWDILLQQLFRPRSQFEIGYSFTLRDIIGAFLNEVFRVFKEPEPELYGTICARLFQGKNPLELAPYLSRSYCLSLLAKIKRFELVEIYVHHIAEADPKTFKNEIDACLKLFSDDFKPAIFFLIQKLLLQKKLEKQYSLPKEWNVTSFITSRVEMAENKNDIDLWMSWLAAYGRLNLKAAPSIPLAHQIEASVWRIVAQKRYTDQLMSYIINNFIPCNGYLFLEEMSHQLHKHPLDNSLSNGNRLFYRYLWEKISHMATLIPPANKSNHFLSPVLELAPPFLITNKGIDDLVDRTILYSFLKNIFPHVHKFTSAALQTICKLIKACNLGFNHPLVDHELLSLLFDKAGSALDMLFANIKDKKKLSRSTIEKECSHLHLLQTYSLVKAIPLKEDISLIFSEIFFIVLMEEFAPSLKSSSDRLTHTLLDMKEFLAKNNFLTFIVGAKCKPLIDKLLPFVQKREPVILIPKKVKSSEKKPREEPKAAPSNYIEPSLADKIGHYETKEFFGSFKEVSKENYDIFLNELKTRISRLTDKEELPFFSFCFDLGRYFIFRGKSVRARHVAALMKDDLKEKLAEEIIQSALLSDDLKKLKTAEKALAYIGYDNRKANLKTLIEERSAKLKREIFASKRSTSQTKLPEVPAEKPKLQRRNTLTLLTDPEVIRTHRDRSGSVVNSYDKLVKEVKNLGIRFLRSGHGGHEIWGYEGNDHLGILSIPRSLHTQAMGDKLLAEARALFKIYEEAMKKLQN